jgi:CubicO group peptidase (beta-lactamase class C family)
MRINNAPTYPHPHTTHTPNPLRDDGSYQNYEKKIPMREDTIFRVFSQSKPISTAAFLTLVDEVRGET